MELYDQGRFLEAHERLAQAYAQQADPVLLYSLGRTLHKAGRPREAVTYYQLFLNAGAAGDPAQRSKAEQYLAQAQKESATPPVSAHSQPSVVSSAGAAAPAAPPRLSPQPKTQVARMAQPLSTARPQAMSRSALLLGLGVPVTSIGLSLIVLGGASFSVDGQCAQSLDQASMQMSAASNLPLCSRLYDSSGAGAALTSAGAVVLVGGLGLTIAGGVLRRRTSMAPAKDKMQ
jgi:hypothetical protein